MLFLHWQDVVLTVSPYLWRLCGDHCRHPAASLPPRHPLTESYRETYPPFPLHTHPLQLLLPLPPYPDPLSLPQATQRVSCPSPRAGGRPANLAAAAASSSHFYPLLQTEAGGSPHVAASMSPTAVSPGGGGGGSLQGPATSAAANPCVIH